jgi:condensin complex subunit 2
MSRAVRKLTPSALQELFSNCLKLSSENKINSKNTWDLNLIDYIDEVIEDTLKKDESNFQVAR